VALIETPCRKRCDAAFCERAADTAPTMRGRNGQVLEIAAAAIRATEDGANDATLVARDEAEAWVLGEVAENRFALIDVTKDEAVSVLPQDDDLFVIVRPELTELEHHTEYGIRITPRSPAGDLEEGVRSSPSVLEEAVVGGRQRGGVVVPIGRMATSSTKRG
jgi:hypothetical protein